MSSIMIGSNSQSPGRGFLSLVLVSRCVATLLREWPGSVARSSWPWLLAFEACSSAGLLKDFDGCVRGF